MLFLSFSLAFFQVIELSGMMNIFFYPIVKADKVAAWNNFTRDNLDWFERGRRVQRANGFELTDLLPEDYKPIFYTDAFAQEPLTFDENGIGSDVYTFAPDFSATVVDNGPEDLTPLWQLSPVLPTSAVNLNVGRFPGFGEAIQATIAGEKSLFGKLDVAPPNDLTNPNELTGAYYAQALSYHHQKKTPYLGDPFSSIYVPIYDSFDLVSRKMVGFLISGIQWASYFEDIFPVGTGTIRIVLENTCGDVGTYEINGPHVEFIGMGNHHDTSYSDLEKSTSFDALLNAESPVEKRIPLNQDWCAYTLRVYPTADFEDTTTTNNPIFITIAVGAIFIFTGILFLVYDKLVERRQSLVMNTAEKSNAIVSNLFPKSVQDRLLNNPSGNNGLATSFASDKKRVKSFLTGGGDGGEDMGMTPIADLFPNTTVIFMDISGKFDRHSFVSCIAS